MSIRTFTLVTILGKGARSAKKFHGDKEAVSCKAVCV